MLNRIAAGAVAPAVAGLLNAGRGVVKPRVQVGGLWLIAGGNIFMRLIGSLSLASEFGRVCRKFLSAAPLQLGVGV